MTFASNFGAFFLAPFMAISAFFGLGNHATSTPPTASSTAWMASSTPRTATSTGIHFPGSNGGVKLPHGINPGGPMIPYHGATTTPATTTPVINSESITSAAVGAQVTLTGSGFTSASVVHFAVGTINPTSVSATGTSLTFTVPSSIGPHCFADQACPMYVMLVRDGSYKIYVENVPAKGDTTGPESNSVDLTVTGAAILTPSL